jgi:hypothetical protein
LKSFCCTSVGFLFRHFSSCEFRNADVDGQGEKGSKCSDSPQFPFPISEPQSSSYSCREALASSQYCIFPQVSP